MLVACQEELTSLVLPFKGTCEGHFKESLTEMWSRLGDGTNFGDIGQQVRAACIRKPIVGAVTPHGVVTLKAGSSTRPKNTSRLMVPLSNDAVAECPVNCVTRDEASSENIFRIRLAPANSLADFNLSGRLLDVDPSPELRTMIAVSYTRRTDEEQSMCFVVRFLAGNYSHGSTCFEADFSEVIARLDTANLYRADYKFELPSGPVPMLQPRANA
jgi:hypothetical protein